MNRAEFENKYKHLLRSLKFKVYLPYSKRGLTNRPKTFIFEGRKVGGQYARVYVEANRHNLENFAFTNKNVIAAPHIPEYYRVEIIDIKKYQGLERIVFAYNINN